MESQPSRFSAGMWAVVLFISSETMFFSALFTTYFYLRARIPEWEPVFQRCVSAECEKPTWQSLTEIGGLAIPLVLINTVVLVSSSVTMQLAVNAIKKDERGAGTFWLALTVAMGTWFILGQGYEYFTLGFLPDNSIFAAVFFTLTGFHGAHVTGGIVANALALFRTTKGHFTARRHLFLEGASIYWHFVDIVWIGLFTTIYIIG
ncbi:MAG: heme-copper oxidase subunit III [Chloroflexi bacterium]|nr:heme-copper oxidase subunit III [Chloroflexota bacterium]